VLIIQRRRSPLIRRALDDGATINDLAVRAHVPARRFRSILAGDQANVSFGVADAIVTHALDGPTLWLRELSDLYGAAARAANPRCGLARRR
jgi:hypothetical protein